MTTRTETPFVLSDLPIPPGEILEEELEARGVTRNELATLMAIDPQTIGEIVRGEKAIDAETAVNLANALGIGAHYWLGLEADYAAALGANGAQTETKHESPPLDPISLYGRGRARGRRGV